MDKIELLSRVLQADGRKLAMVFTKTKRRAQKACDELTDRGFAVATVHGDLGQGAREEAKAAAAATLVAYLMIGFSAFGMWQTWWIATGWIAAVLWRAVAGVVVG